MLSVFLHKIISSFRVCLAYFSTFYKGFLQYSKPSENHTKNKQRMELLRSKFPEAPDHWLEKIADCGESHWLKVDLKEQEHLQIKEVNFCNQAHLPDKSKQMPHKVQGEESKKNTHSKSVNIIKISEVKSKTAVKNKTLDVAKENNTENKDVRVMPDIHKMKKRLRLLRLAAAKGVQTKLNRKEKQAEFSVPFKSTKKIVSNINAEIESREKKPGKSYETVDFIKKRSMLTTLWPSSDCEVAELSKELKRKKCKERLNHEKKRHDQKEYKRDAFREPGFSDILGQKVEGCMQISSDRWPRQKVEGNKQISIDRWPSLPETEDFLQDEDFDSIGQEVEEI